MEFSNKSVINFYDDSKESDFGKIQSISGPIIVAENLFGAAMYELTRIGPNRLLGEVIKLSGETATIQVFEETAGLTIGDSVERLRKPMSVELGPGLSANIFDGIQRPLQKIENIAEGIYIPKGVNIPALDREKSWYFQPQIKIGDHISQGDVFGKVEETPFITHLIMLPPGEKGIVTYIAPIGNYTLEDVVLEVEFNEKTKKFTMLQNWPIRVQRPISENLALNNPLFTGQRVLDTFFPLAQGGTCVIPGAFGSGKGVITQSVAKWSNSDVLVFCLCGERGNEAAELLMELPEITTVMRGVRDSVLNKSVVVANASNMPLAAREACIHTGLAIAEYYRDMGLNTTMIADSTSRWIEALREVSVRMEEIPGEQMYPANIGSKLAGLYQRAGRISCLGSPSRIGSLSIMGTVSPPGGDFSDAVVSITLNLTQTFWGLDKKLAQRKHFPSVNWLKSFSKSKKMLENYYEENFPGFYELSDKLMAILRLEDDLTDIVLLVGKESMPDEDLATLEIAKMIRWDFLQQNLFTTYDRFCPQYKSLWMMKIFVYFYEEVQKLIKEKKVPWREIESKMKDQMYKISCAKFEEPISQTAINTKFQAINDELVAAFYDFVIDED